MKRRYLLVWIFLIFCVSVPAFAQPEGYVKVATSTSITMYWTAPADHRNDGSLGVVAYYIMKVSTDSITSENFDLAMDVDGEPIPTDSGTVQSMEVHNLLPNSEYFFAMKAVDDSGNISDISNVPRRSTMRVVTTIYASPNPVDFSQYSMTTFSGVPQGSFLLIADSNGTLVRSWSDCSDTVIWDGTDMQGRSVVPGRYFWSIPDTHFKGIVLIQ